MEKKLQIISGALSMLEANMKLEIWENCDKVVLLNPAAFQSLHIEQFKSAGWKVAKTFETTSRAEAYMIFQQWQATLTEYKVPTVCDSVKWLEI